MFLSKFLKKVFLTLTPEQKIKFQQYLPTKVYQTEKNISILVAASQLCMILLFLSNKRVSFENPRTLGYFSLYVFLLTITGIAYLLYTYTVRHQKMRAFLWVRRIYAFLLCAWVIGITFLEQMNGNGLSVYYYLLPTTAALLLLTPTESTIIIGSTWCSLMYILYSNPQYQDHMFGYMVNSIFVTVLSLFISLRYYQSTAQEFLDRETIAAQYDEIKTANQLLARLAHVDQLTSLYNRHYLHEAIYPIFSDFQKENAFGVCLMMDIDYFKQYNDLFGHLQGDDCLKRIARVFEEFCEANNATAIRYGGEEFLLLRFSQQPFDAMVFAKNVHDTLQQANIPRDDVPLKRVTVSGGLWFGSLQEVPEIEIAIQQADDALYQAKSQGRNRIVSAVDGQTAAQCN